VSIVSTVDVLGIRTITLDRPPANAITREMLRALRDAFIEAHRDWSTKVVILEGRGEKFFCAGMDLKQSPADGEPLLQEHGVPSYGASANREVFAAIHDCGVPVIAKVRGTAVGAGFFYACLADFVVAGDKARFGQFEIKVGAVGGAGIVRRMLTEQAMRYLGWTAELVDAADLVALGAGIKLVPDAEVDDAVDSLAALLASRSAALNRHTKLSLNRVEGMGAKEAFAFEQMHSQILALQGQRGSPDREASP
jgi:enoyl-CoA hydratase